MTENNVVVLDDHPMFLVGLKRIINHESGFTVTDCCKNSNELFFSLSLVPANIAIIDCSRPDGDLDIVTLVDQLSRCYPEMTIITMGDCSHHQKQSERLQPRVKSYFCKSLTPENLITGLRHVWIKCQHEERNLISQRVDVRLSEKEKTVMEYIHAGLSVSQTALRLSRSVKTISAQKRTAMRKLGLNRDSEIFRLNINDI